MKKILIPSDFSDLADYAYSLAQFIAKSGNMQIDVISVIPGPKGAFYTNSGELITEGGNDYNEWHKRLVKNKESMQEWVKGKSHIANTYCIIAKLMKR